MGVGNRIRSGRAVLGYVALEEFGVLNDNATNNK